MTASKTSIVRLLAGSGCALLLFLGFAQRPDPSTVNKQAVRDAFAAMDQQDYARLRTLLPRAEARTGPSTSSDRRP